MSSGAASSGYELVELRRLEPAEWNPRTITKARFQALKASIRADPSFLELRPLLARTNGTVLAGNMRHRALVELYKEGWESPWGNGVAPAVLLDISDEDARARAIRDNASGGEWQEQELAELVYGLRESGVDVGALGFEESEVLALLDSVGAGPDVEQPTKALPGRRDLPLDAIFTSGSGPCCIAVLMGMAYGFQSGGTACANAKANGYHKVAFVDNEYTAYRHDVHLRDVKEHRPKYATVRDAMTEEQCRAAGIEYFPLSRILDWAEELAEHADNVIVIPKYDCLDDIPEKFVLGYSIPTSHGGTPLSWERFKGRRVHLLGGSWSKQLSYLAALGDDVVSLDMNYVYKTAMWGSFVTPEGGTMALDDLGLGRRLTSPLYVALALSVDSIATKLKEVAPGFVAPDPRDPQEDRE
jgi:hypothetical protein